jgi:hypothetical protein
LTIVLDKLFKCCIISSKRGKFYLDPSTRRISKLQDTLDPVVVDNPVTLISVLSGNGVGNTKS